MVGIIYGSSTGTTERVAQAIQQLLGSGKSEVENISDISSADLEKYDSLILGTSTWGIGDLQDDWEDGIEKLKSADLVNKNVALFGCGDQEGYPDSFIDGVGLLHQAVADKGAQVKGQWPTDGYDFAESKAVKQGLFVGLAIDEDNQSDLTDQRISDWLAALEF